jgi:DNA modification methylase
MNNFWQRSLDQTVQYSTDLLEVSAYKQDVAKWFDRYVASAPTSSNQGTANLPFQRWFRFKEAFSPKFVADTISSLPYKVERCLDPFSGSGTTAVTCRMLGISSVGVEVNPFLADLIEAKLTPIQSASFCESYENLISSLVKQSDDEILLPGMPPTLSAPGVNGRYVFSNDVFSTVRAIVRASKQLESTQQRLLRVLLGGVLVENSNVTINGKGRRYRRGWEKRSKSGADLTNSLDAAVDMAITDLTDFAGLPRGEHEIHRGDARRALANVSDADVAIFSPPYPNSFDYTDVYNLELWMLGYLSSAPDNKALRTKTLRSHVQTKWETMPRYAKSAALSEVFNSLSSKRSDLWNQNIPEMILFYFEDLLTIFQQLSRILKTGHHAVVAIGDSQYAGIHIDVATILAEVVRNLGFSLVKRGEMRSMRNSSQHGGNFSLSEHCLVFEKVGSNN